jgi:hypothetical protein
MPIKLCKRHLLVKTLKPRIRVLGRHIASQKVECMNRRSKKSQSRQYFPRLNTKDPRIPIGASLLNTKGQV